MKNKKKIIIIIISSIILCLSFYLVFYFVKNQEVQCSLKQSYSNYDNSIEVIITGNKKANIKEIFVSKDQDILLKHKENMLSLKYSSTIINNKVISNKIISDTNLKKQYIESGYKCNKKQEKLKIVYKLENDNSSLEVKDKFEYNDIKAKVNKKNYKSKIEVSNNINTNQIGKYVVSYKLNISKVRNEFLYHIIEVKDTTKPTIKLKGDEIYYIAKGKKFNDPGVDYSDNYDDKELLILKQEGTIDTDKVGEYIIKYIVVDSSKNKNEITRKVVVYDEIKSGLTYINGILIANKKYSLPRDYNPGLNESVKNAYDKLATDAQKEGMTIPLVSGFRSYEYQEQIYNNYVKIYGKKETDTFSAVPGHSEHQTGLAMDVGVIDDNYGETREGKWLAENCYKYGFIIRYPKGKEHITGYKYEPWHIRYLGTETAEKVYKSGLTLEEYLNIN